MNQNALSIIFAVLTAVLGCHILYADVEILNQDQIIRGTEKESISFQMMATNGIPPYVWDLSGEPNYCIERKDSSFSEIGTAMGWQEDDESWLFNLPFEFSFYGKKYTEVYVNDNGTLSFGEALSNYYYDEGVFLMLPMIAPLWDDLIASQGEIYVQMNSNSVTFRWDRVYYSYDSQEANFSVTLCQSGDIVFSYGSGNFSGFIGLSAGDGKNYVEIGDIPGSYIKDIELRPDRSVVPGMVLLREGLLYGVPLQSGTNTFDVVVADANGSKANASATLIIDPNVNKRPIIEGFSPTNTIDIINVDETDGMTFSVSAKDPEGVPLSFIWDSPYALMRPITREQMPSVKRQYLTNILTG